MAQIGTYPEATSLNDTDEFPLALTSGGLTKKVLFSTLKSSISFPVGSQYTQYPTVQSNTIATALPSSESPATLFGGTWAEIKIGGAGSDEEEAIFYRTGGKHLEAAETTNRTDGKQTDHMQGFQVGNATYYQAILTPDAVNTAAAVATYGQIIAGTTLQGNAGMMKAVNDGTNGDIRSAKENYPVNRIFKTWEKTSLT